MTQTHSLSQCLSCGSQNLKHLITTPAQMHHTKETFRFVQCNSCNLVMLNPRVNEDQLHQYYSEYYLPFRGSSAWGKYAPLVYASLHKTDTKRVKLSKKTTLLNSQSKVLDLGCGKPTFLKLLHQQTGAHCKGVDFSDEGWKNHPEEFKEIELEVADLKNINSANTYDLITMWHYLEHAYNPLDTLNQLKKIAHQNTRLLIEVPNYNSWTRRLQKSHWEGFHTPRHTAVYEPKTITTLLQNAGWKVESIKSYGTLEAYPLYWMGKQEKKGIDWSQSMESKFVGFVACMILTLPIFLLKRWLSAGIMLIVAKPQ